jgi:hypothetical protein
MTRLPCTGHNNTKEMLKHKEKRFTFEYGQKKEFVLKEHSHNYGKIE